MALAFMGAVTACVNDDEAIDNSFKQTNKEWLSVSPTVSGSPEVSIATRAGSDANLQEIALNTLDVFVEKTTKKTVEGKDVFTGDGNIMKQYHLVGTAAKPIQYNDLNKLADSWRNEGLEVGQTYNIYVAANNPLTHPETEITTVSELKGLTFKEQLVLDDYKNIGWDDNTTSGNIYKLYNANPGNHRALTSEKEFMMDKVIQWSPTAGAKDQTFDVELNRAAAKIVLNVEFDKNFVASLANDYNPKTEKYDIPKDSKDVVRIIGNPAWKFNNFAFGAHVFDPEEAEGVEVHNSGFNIIETQQSIAGGASFTITTYTYPNTWDPAEVATKAPSLVLSIRYQQGGEKGPISDHYYRIPIVPLKDKNNNNNPVTSINRNTQYVINATIATRGSESHEDVNEVEDISYKVTSWNNEKDDEQQSGDVTSVQNYYLQVNPKVYTLRGDGEQTIDIHFSRAKNTSVDYKLFTFPSGPVDLSDNTPIVKTPVTPSNSAVWGWYFSDDKRMITSVTGMTHMGVTITNNNTQPATAEETEGTITVKSTALPNRAIKYILLRVYLKEKEGYYEDVLIRHFPTDNIQSDKGLWSSRTTNGWWRYANGTGNDASGTKWDGNPNNSLSNVFSAKYFYNNDHVRNWTLLSSMWGTYEGWDDSDYLTNPYKYVIQISSTSVQYVMGRPVLDSNSQSKDHVVSPAFMIASQLGATSSKSPQNNQIADMGRYAANHCATYKEVDVIGNGVEGETLWTGWRLPTREEVGVILKYQKAGYDTMDPVLTGRYYWTLEGAAVATGVNDQWANSITWYNDWETRYQNTANDYKYGTYRGTDIYGRTDQNVQESSFIRCIRDLSAEEIENLNKWNTIIAKFQAK